MPIGSYAAVPWLAETLIRARPHSVLDLGLGFGGGGSTVREWLDLGVRPWKTYLVGVEVWADYRNPVWDVYDAIYVQTIEQFLQTNSERFEMVLLCDVLEHFDKPAGHKLLDAVKSHVSPRGCFLVVTPAAFFPQSAVYGNEWERHRSEWTPTDLDALGFSVQRLGTKELVCGECLVAKWQR